MLRGVDANLWRRVRLEAVKRGWTTGELVSHALREWMARHEGGR